MSEKKEINVGGVKIDWDLDTGKVLFEGRDVVFFWVSAMKTFFDTIREISGAEATNLVLETTAFRQGLIVGETFGKIKGITEANVVEWLSSTYAPAGWGKAEIVEMDESKNRFLLHLQDDWEYKMNSSEGGFEEGIFVPAHYAGVFTSLFKQNYWYKVLQSQNKDNRVTIVEYYPSNTDVEQNILELAKRQEALEFQKRESLVEEKTKVLQELIKELSSPVIPVLNEIVVVPLIGSYDFDRAEELMVNTLTKLPKHQAKYLLLDLTGLNSEITQHTADLIHKLGSAAGLLGTETILVGISSELALLISNSLTSLKKFECLQTLQHGIYYALGKSGRKIV